MTLLSEIYDVTSTKREFRGKAKEGLIRPTITQFFTCNRPFYEVESYVDPSDDFDSTTLNTRRWLPQRNGTNDLYLADGKLVLSASTKDPALGFSKAAVQANALLEGNFDVQVDFSDFSSLPINVSDGSFRMRVYSQAPDGNRDLGIAFASKTNGKGYWSWHYDPYPTSIPLGQLVGLSISSGKVRIKRYGNTFSTYYWENEAWVLFGLTKTQL